MNAHAATKKRRQLTNTMIERYSDSVYVAMIEELSDFADNTIILLLIYDIIPCVYLLYLLRSSRAFCPCKFIRQTRVF